MGGFGICTRVLRKAGSRRKHRSLARRNGDLVFALFTSDASARHLSLHPHRCGPLGVVSGSVGTP